MMGCALTLPQVGSTQNQTTRFTSSSLRSTQERPRHTDNTRKGRLIASEIAPGALYYQLLPVQSCAVLPLVH